MRKGLIGSPFARELLGYLSFCEVMVIIGNILCTSTMEKAKEEEQISALAET